ncbi:putative membrane protein [Neolewinella xylanilytica]|uniref:Putative membrane protein n=1 Tax=Neolewinella xylanilytica TaxID=1514080 RepID=A0A2S6I6G7_9BACT|nr:DUF1772 domain-containing protein [Neolewinella xylanilytica]PPK87088.1 putative membrane protein [Neolewinella xylanilytica]
METTINTLTCFSSVVLTGLSAGLFYGWEFSVIPGTRQVGDAYYLYVMQSINRAILNPAFFLVFFGSPLALAAATLLQYRGDGSWGWWLAATLLYLIGTFGVTAFGNVPLNEALDALDLADLLPEEEATTRKAYESRWNRLHTVRTAAAVLSFAAAVVGALTTGPHQ